MSWRFLFIIAACFLGMPSITLAEPLPSAVLIRIADDRLPEIVPIASLGDPALDRERGLLVSTEGRREVARSLPPQSSPVETLDALAAATRAANAAGEIPAGADSLAAINAAPLDQFAGLAVMRGATLLTPVSGGPLLNPRLTIRRPAESGSELPATVLELRQLGRVILKIPLQRNQARLAWGDIPALPSSLAAGLPPGQYSLRDPKSGQTTTFEIETQEARESVMETLRELEQLLTTTRHPLYLEITASRLLDHRDDSDQARPYLDDALELLESAPAELRTPHLERLHDQLLAGLRGQPDPPSRDTDPTGLAEIDRARQLLREAKWDAAWTLLGNLSEGPGTSRATALAALYRGVLLAESSTTADSAAQAWFLYALSLASDRRDLFRIRNNYANFLLGRAQDGLYNRAFQIASGRPSPLIAVLMDCRESLRQYETALQLAREVQPAGCAAVQVNLSRAYNLLSDVIRTLTPRKQDDRRFQEASQAAAVHARELAASVADAPPSEDDLCAPAAQEVLAQLALHAGQIDECRKRAQEAIKLYLRSGALAGVESAYRTLGIAVLHDADAAATEHRTALRQESLRYLRLSEFLAQWLRQQMPSDQIGLSRAGFFARRAYVSQRIAEILIEQGKAAEALGYVEDAKARGLNDVLAAAIPSAQAFTPAHKVPEILEHWPDQVAALEYFLADREAWLFVINSSGGVTVHTLRDASGRALRSQYLIAQVKAFLDAVDHQAESMRRRLAAGQGFDHGWQEQLHEIYRELIPADVLPELRHARTVLVAPHHLLHYFPMAALVTEPDRSPRSSAEMVKPRFLIDEPFTLCSCPSLCAWDALRQRPDRPIRQAIASGVVEFPNAAPLPGVQKDLDNLSAVFGSSLRHSIPNAEASETRVRALFDQPGLLFLGTHGQNLADQPLASFLLFHPDRRNDGYLMAREIYCQRVAADLVVLSACYSGLADGSPLPGDDLFGLQRALLHAGARSVVGSLWDVYDGTGPELMRRFFRELADGRPAPAALAGAQRDFLASLRASPRTEPWLHPYFWAVYTVNGDDRPHCR